MGMFQRMAYAFGCLIAAACILSSPCAVAQQGLQPQMPQIIEQFSADLEAIDRTYSVGVDPARGERLKKFYSTTEADLAAIDFDSLSHEDQVDYLLLRHFMISGEH